MKFAILLSFSLFAGADHAQSPDTLMVPMTGQERSLVLSMCQSAVWANRQAFDGVCEFFKVKFDTVVKATADKAAEKPAPAPGEPKE